MSDEVPQSAPQEHRPTGEDQASPRVSLDKPQDEGPQGRAPWAASGEGSASGSGQEPIPEARPGAAPRDGYGAVHYQQTVTSLPSSPDEPADAVPSAWAPPAADSAPPAANPFAPPAATPPPANPYAPPAAPANPYAPAAATAHAYAPPAAPANPYAPPVSYAPPAARHAGPEPVPPPPIAPDGPGQVPYGYPGPAAYGYPGRPQPPYAGPYGWPGMQPVPSNGLGTASLVLGILGAVCFLLWPIALVLGILGIIFGAVGRAKANRGEATNPGVALAGLICGAAGIVLALVFIAALIAAGS
ncbi:DUF4190 domain-containing protein [Streptomyces sp. NPDC048304]|uniref:DUF4190 domain-containing protein n=1 Tax=Streptomyces sp. NPDC048304 TaxID=3154820 RepID=UPI0033C90702